MEQWKPIQGFENEYEISNTGLVKSIEREILTKFGVKRRVSGRVLKPKNNGQGYLFVSLSKRGERKDLYIHRLVATAFLTKPPGKNNVNHKNGDPSSNAVSNLEWVNHSENVFHAYRNGLYKTKGVNVSEKANRNLRNSRNEFSKVKKTNNTTFYNFYQ